MTDTAATHISDDIDKPNTNLAASPLTSTSNGDVLASKLDQRANQATSSHDQNVPKSNDNMKREPVSASASSSDTHGEGSASLRSAPLPDGNDSGELKHDSSPQLGSSTDDSPSDDPAVNSVPEEPVGNTSTPSVPKKASTNSLSTSSKAGSSTGIVADGTGIVADGSGTVANGTGTVADGTGTVADGTGIVADGNGIVADGTGTVADGTGTVADGTGTVADGTGTVADGTGTVADGTGTVADGTGTVADGTGIVADAPSGGKRDDGSGPVPVSNTRKTPSDVRTLFVKQEGKVDNSSLTERIYAEQIRTGKHKQLISIEVDKYGKKTMVRPGEVPACHTIDISLGGKKRPMSREKCRSSEHNCFQPPKPRGGRARSAQGPGNYPEFMKLSSKLNEFVAASVIEKLRLKGLAVHLHQYRGHDLSPKILAEMVMKPKKKVTDHYYFGYVPPPDRPRISLAFKRYLERFEEIHQVHQSDQNYSVALENVRLLSQLDGNNSPLPETLAEVVRAQEEPGFGTRQYRRPQSALV